jgi:hypothetical protein
VAPGAVAGAGVDAASEALSPDGVGAAGVVVDGGAAVVVAAVAGTAAELEVEEEADGDDALTLVSVCDCVSSAGRPGKRLRREDESFRVTVLLGFGDLTGEGDDPTVAVVVLVVDMFFSKSSRSFSTSVWDRESGRCDRSRW